MRPALQILLARPSSLELLRCLVGTPVPFAPSPKDRICYRGKANRACQYSSMLATAQAVEAGGSEDGCGSPFQPLKGRHDAKSDVGPISSETGLDTPSEDGPDTGEGAQPLKFQQDRELAVAVTQSGRLQRAQRKAVSSTEPRLQRFCGGDGEIHSNYGRWNENLWPYEQLEFESDLDAYLTSKRRLLDDPVHKTDMELWACLLGFRQRTYGLEGISMYWRAIYHGNIELPVTGHAARTLWAAFLKLGFQDDTRLIEIWKYANWLLATTGKRWNMLYVKIIQYFLLNGQGQQAMKWHERLHFSHPPGPKGFAEMFRQVALWKGDMTALRKIYEKNNIRNVYGKVVPILCHQENFGAALQWHSMLMRHQDRPRSSEVVEPLIDFLALYDNKKAVLVTKSLVEAGVPFRPGKSPSIGKHSLISRELMNIIHGETFHIPVKKYNDNLGARWFATSWISMDVAINAVHALGVQEIGPLSLQAIGLREMDSKSLVKRIKQLKELGISIGDSVFSRAVEEFARTRRQDFLEGILQSDQHPDALEDWKLQEALLTSSAQAKDWPQYRRTLAIRLIGSKSREVDARNITLRDYISRGDIAGFNGTLLKMQAEGIPVKARTITYLVMKTLQRRQRGRRPVIDHNYTRDLDAIITTLKGIMISGTSVAVTHWREPIRRLGMLGLLEDLYPLCLFLASWYGPIRRGALRGFHETRQNEPRPRKPYRQIPAAVPTSHRLHPLKVLFPVPLQKAIVEWGFIRGLRGKPKRGARTIALQPQNISSPGITMPAKSIVDVTSGIKHLQRLQDRGVDIDIKCIRSAIFNRLVAYYGHGRSSRLYNRVARENNPLSFDEMVRQIDDAMGGRAFPRITNLKKVVEMASISRTGHVKIRREKRTSRLSAVR